MKDKREGRDFDLFTFPFYLLSLAKIAPKIIFGTVKLTVAMSCDYSLDSLYLE